MRTPPCILIVDDEPMNLHILFFFYCYGDHRDLHSFPTRRSSDLYLVEIHTGDHGAENPGYARISFYFRVGFPTYNVQYVSQVLTEGKGDPLPLEGNAALRVGFVDANVRDENGHSTIVFAAPTRIGFRNLKSYGFAGDFEGYVSYGLGIQVAPGSDQALPIRVGELRKPDGKGGYLYVVAVDVRVG